MSALFKNELAPEFLGVVGLNPFAAYISASRLAMFCNHIGQHLVVKDCTVNRLSTGVGREYAKDVHAIRMPCNAIIVKVIRKYPEQIDGNIPGENPTTVVVYQDNDSPTGEIGVLVIEHRHCLHQHYGFTYVMTPDFYRLAPDVAVDKGTVLATSPTITEAGDHRFGLEAQVAFMSLPGVAEDGVIVSESFCKRMTTRGYGTRTVSWGKNAMPLNKFGDDTRFKAFPDIGESVGSDGLLWASRSYDDMLSIAMMSNKALRTLDYFDKPHYAPGARVTDVTILKGNKNKAVLPHGMEDQCRYYYQRGYAFHEEIIAVERDLRRRYGTRLHLSKRFHNLVVESLAVTTMAERSHVVPTFNKQPVDEWVVQLSFDYEVIPTIGFKLTGLHGDKGVIVEIRPDADMPVDGLGNRAEIIMDGDSTLKRTNVGRVYEQYINAAGYATTYRLRDMVASGATLDQQMDYLMGFYRLTSPVMHDNAQTVLCNDIAKAKHSRTVLRKGIYLHLPTDNQLSYLDVCANLRQHYPACNGPVTYRGNSGKLVTTKSNVIIGGMYIMLLEKTGNTWGAVNSAKSQHFGIPAKLNNSDKYSAAGRHNPVRIAGEAEVRAIAATCGGDTAAEMIDQTNSPTVHRSISESALRATRPTDVESAVDRSIHPRGRGRILTLINHELECGGLKFVTGVEQ